MTKRLFVGNISYDTRASTLRAVFASCGEIANVEVVTDGGTGRP